jgi:ATP-dependent helicase/nuclease subunit B
VVQQKNNFDIDIAKNLEIIFKDMLAKTTSDLSFKFTDWFEIFKTLLSKKEIKIKNGHPDGVQIRDLGAVYLNNVTHRIWFGLDDSVFQNKSKNLIPIKDIEILKNVFDFPLQYPEESHDDFNLRWLSESACLQQYFTCAHVSLMAEPLNPALFILENNIKPDYLFTPETRLDQIQNQYKNESNLKLSNEMQTVPTQNNIPSFKPTEVSGTDVANYAQCEFKLLASRGFRLRDYSVVSVDLDPMQRGTLAHDLFQYLMTEELYKSVTDLQINNFLEEKRIKQKLFPNDDLFWSLQKSKFLQIAKRFCTHEIKRLNGRAFKHILEKEFSLLHDHIKINGRIDRIDVDATSGDHLIYDYKRSGSTAMSGPKTWLSKKEFQMLFYLLAVIEQTANAEQVRGAVYYFYQKLETNKGIIKVGNEKFEAVVAPTKSMNLSADDFNQLITEFKSVLTDVFVKLKKSEFSANPYDKSICTDCDWRRLCRAPHLN